MKPQRTLSYRTHHPKFLLYSSAMVCVFNRPTSSWNIPCTAFRRVILYWNARTPTTATATPERTYNPADGYNQPRLHAVCSLGGKKRAYKLYDITIKSPQQARGARRHKEQNNRPTKKTRQIHKQKRKSTLLLKQTR